MFKRNKTIKIWEISIWETRAYSRSQGDEILLSLDPFSLTEALTTSLSIKSWEWISSIY